LDRKENLCHKVLFISAQDMSHNGRYLKLIRTFNKLAIPTHALILSNNGPVSQSGNYTSIFRPHWGRADNKFRLLRSMGYRWQRHISSLVAQNKNACVYHAMDYIALDIAGEMKRKYGGRLVFDACEIFSGTPYTTPELKSYIRKIYQRNAKYIDAVITPSVYLKRYYSATYPNLPEASIISNGTDLSITTPYDNRLHKKIRVSNSDRILLYHGGFSHNRGLEELVSSALHLPENYRLVLIGKGVLKNELKFRSEAVNSHSLRDKIFILPPVPNNELLDWIAGAEYGLIPYEKGHLNHTLCTPNKLYEFSAAGVPVLATNLQALDHIIKEHEIGATFENLVFDNRLVRFLENVTEKDTKFLKKSCEKFAAKEKLNISDNKIQDIWECFI